MNRERPIIAIDGPAGAGKSTVARRLAEKLAYTLVDTGAMYRAVAFAAKANSVDWANGPALGELANRLLHEAALSFERNDDSSLRVLLYGSDISQGIRTPEMGMAASQVSAHPEVRSALLGLQRQAGEKGGVILEGRDIGTVVFPDAEIKFFLTATPEIRARRRFEELVARGENVSFESTLLDVKRRDEQDMGRKVAPLRPADNAVIVDSSDLDFEQTVSTLADHVRSYPRA